MAGLSNGEAKREVMALMKDIDIYLADGHSRKSIYEKFKSEGHIECGYVIFCRWINKLSNTHPHTIKHTTLPVSEQKPEPKTVPKQTKKIPSADQTSAEPSGVRVAKTIMPKLDI